ncbi:fucolectin-1-like [Mercenaria mercenaria]|uniref:fucolectin-1-like n=1 Tax=Mercenaria mercenaria TaxID=6596 RepID=UPI00234F84E3|nr:fucolectin-1-like [Mercenaria mercenaria]
MKMATVVTTLKVTTIFMVWIIISAEANNIALNKQAYQTDTSSDNLPSLAVDGDLHGTCASTITNDASWEVDLGDTYIIGSVKIYNSIDCCSKDLRDLHIFTGLTNDAYELGAFMSGPSGTIITWSVPSPLRARWVKVNRKTGQRSPLTICEVEVFEGVALTSSTAMSPSPPPPTTPPPPPPASVTQAVTGGNSGVRHHRKLNVNVSLLAGDRIRDIRCRGNPNKARAKPCPTHSYKSNDP